MAASTKDSAKSHADMYKKGVDEDEGRRRREETSVQIRKQKRNERLNQRRKMGTPTQAHPKINSEVFMHAATKRNGLV